MIRPGRRWRRRAILWSALLLFGLPAALTAAYSVVPVPITPLMVLRLIEGEGLSKTWTPLDEISAYVPEAVVAAEDNLFCRHGGFDWDAIGGQVEIAIQGEQPRGASTISMQTAKNLFLWPGRDYLRKALEAYLTPYVEFFFGKRRIVEVYLNIAEWGPGLYGIEAASQAYFGKPARDLSRREAALLAAVLPNPRAWSPAPADPHVADRAAVLIARMAQIAPLLDCLEAR